MNFPIFKGKGREGDGYTYLCAEEEDMDMGAEDERANCRAGTKGFGWLG
jgi:hypothetical protein